MAHLQTLHVRDWNSNTAPLGSAAAAAPVAVEVQQASETGFSDEEEDEEGGLGEVEDELQPEFGGDAAFTEGSEIELGASDDDDLLGLGLAARRPGSA